MNEDWGSLLASYAVTQDTPHVPLKAFRAGAPPST